jgi:predicted nucleic acid-binding protein
MTAGSRIFLDTNVVVYLYDPNEPVKQRQASEIVERQSGTEFVVSAQVLQELYAVMVRKGARAAATTQAEAAVRATARLPVVQIDVPLILDAITLSRRHDLSFWDALIVCSALAGGCTRLLSEDLQPGQTFGSLVVENPFAPPRASDGAPVRPRPRARRASVLRVARRP